MTVEEVKENPYLAPKNFFLSHLSVLALPLEKTVLLYYQKHCQVQYIQHW